MTNAVETRDLFRVYPSADGGVAALQGLTLVVEERELCVVLGPSGSGKTTLMRVLAGLDRPSAGAALVAGLDLTTLPERRLARYRGETLGYADQHYWRALAAELTAEELVGVPLGLGGTSAAARRRRARDLLERVGLLDRAHARPGELSGGEQQRIALCAALAARPALLIADEPTGELDADSAEAIYRLLAELVHAEETTALVVSHDPRSTAVADRVIHIRDGRVSEERSGTADAVVVGKGGWLRVPEETLRVAGIGDRARIELQNGVIELHPVTTAVADVDRPRSVLAGSRGALVEVRGLVRRYGREVALAGVDASFGPGRLTVVTGPSGSGKSTLLMLLAGLDLPDDGEVVVDGTVLSACTREERAATRRDRIGFIGQSAALPGFLTARENVELGLALRRVAADEAHDRTADALVAVGLAEHADRPVDRLSSGQRERVAVARALAARPAVLVADEPTARIDAAAAVELGRLLSELAHAYGTTLVCATHDQLLIDLADDEVKLG